VHKSLHAPPGGGVKPVSAVIARNDDALVRGPDAPGQCLGSRSAGVDGIGGGPEETESVLPGDHSSGSVGIGLDGVHGVGAGHRRTVLSQGNPVAILARLKAFANIVESDPKERNPDCRDRSPLKWSRSSVIGRAF